MAASEWKFGELFDLKKFDMTVDGYPQIVDSKYGKAIRFNGIDDGIIFHNNPLIGYNQFTIEMIFYPESGGQFEQRFLHCGSVQGDRLLFELRSTENNQWYFDAFLASGELSMPLIDKEKLHPSDEWYHAAFVVDRGKLTSYINGEKELEGEINFDKFNDGATSIGMRQNKISWFKGMIYNLRVTDAVLQPDHFTKL
jgi:hypothetical protein